MGKAEFPADTKTEVVSKVELTTEGVVSSEIDIAKDIDGGVLAVFADVDILDLADEGKEITLELWVTDDDGNWRFDAGITYRGGDHKNKDAPGFFVSAKEYAGRKTEIRIASPKGGAKAGATLEHITGKQIIEVVEL